MKSPILQATSYKLPATRGFTLIETLIYLSLYAIIISGALAAAYSIFESSAHNQARAMVQEEGSFLIGKIDWAIANVKTVSAPVTSGTTLQVTKYNGTTMTVTVVGQDLFIAENANSPQPLNNTNVGVGNVLFTHSLASADGTNPESIRASLTVNSTTTDGRVFSREFTTVKYLRK